MLDVYDHVTEDELNKLIADKEGVYDLDEGDAEERSPVAECDLCGTSLHAGARYCPGCGNPQTVKAAHKEAPDGVQDPEKTADELDSLSGLLDAVGPATVLTRIIQKDPSLRSEVREIDWDEDDWS